MWTRFKNRLLRQKPSSSAGCSADGPGSLASPPANKKKWGDVPPGGGASSSSEVAGSTRDDGCRSTRSTPERNKRTTIRSRFQLFTGKTSSPKKEDSGGSGSRTVDRKSCGDVTKTGHDTGSPGSASKAESDDLQSGGGGAVCRTEVKIPGDGKKKTGRGGAMGGKLDGSASLERTMERPSFTDYPVWIHRVWNDDDEEDDDDDEGREGGGQGQGEGPSQGQGQSETRDGRAVTINGCGGGGEESQQQQQQRKLHLRFDMSGFEPKTIRVCVDSARITVQARRSETMTTGDKEGGVEVGGGGVVVEQQLFERKIQKPRQVDQTRMKAYLSCDGVLVVEAPLTRNHRNATRGRLTHSVSHTSRRSRASRSSHGGSRSPSSGSPGTPSGGGGGSRGDKPGVPVFKKDEKGVKRLHLLVELGSEFTPDDVIVQVLKENKIQVMAKHKVKTDDRLLKVKYLKEYDLSESIETYSLQGGLTPEGRLVVKALAKGEKEENT